MKVLVTGHKGFLGSKILNSLKEDGEEVYIINEKEKLPKVDWIYHFAAKNGNINYIKTKNKETTWNNLCLDKKIIEHCLNGGAKRLFYPSSACAFPFYIQEEMKDLKEEDVWPAYPETGYGLEKVFMEKLLELFSSDFDVRIGRLFTVYGPGNHYKGRKSKFIGSILKKIIDSEDEIEIWGDGKEIRSIIYISDLIRAVKEIMKSKINTPINVASDVVSVLDIVKFGLDLSKKNLKIKYNINKKNGVSIRIADTKKLKEKINFKPLIDLETGLKNTYNWLLKQKE